MSTEIYVLSLHHSTHVFSKQKNILNKYEWQTLNVLRKDDSTKITKPDKGNGSVIFSEPDYLNKTKQLILMAQSSRKLRITRHLIFTNLKGIKSLTMPPYRRYCHAVPLMVSFMAFQRFINLVGLFALFLLL